MGDERYATDKQIPNVVALYGAGGYGKTTLAGDICRELRRKAAFPDGIVWVALGEGGKRAADDSETIIRRLGGLLDSRFLIVIDDLSDKDDVQRFIAYYSQNCGWLITTRDLNTIEDIVPENRQIRVDQMRRVEAIGLLGTGIEDKTIICTVRRNLHALAEQLGRWPLGLELISGSLMDRVVRKKPLCETIEALRNDLQKGGLSKFDRKKVVSATVKISLNRITGKDRARFRDLSVFTRGVSIPLSTIERFWGHTAHLDKSETEDLCVRLDKLSLLKKLSFDPTKAEIQLHNEISGFLIKQNEKKLADLDNQLLDSHPNNHEWSAMPDDEPYFWDHLTFHLDRAGRGCELVETVKHWRWLATKTRKRGPGAVETDLDKALSISDDTVLPRLKRAFTNHSRWCSGTSEAEIESKLLARLQHLSGCLIGMPTDLTAILKTPYIGVAADFPDLRSHLGADAIREPPEIVKSCSVSHDNLRLAAVSTNGTVKFWDLQNGRPLAGLEEYERQVNACAFSSGGTRMALALADNTLVIKNLASGEVLHPLEGHPQSVTSCAFSPDGSLLVSASSNGAVRVWDAHRGRIRRILKRFVRTWKRNDFSGQWEEGDVRIDGHTGSVNDCAFSPDGKWIVSASDDGTLRVWDGKSGKPQPPKMRHLGPVNACGFSNDGKYLVSASSDRTIKIWNAHTWRIHRTLPREPGANLGESDDPRVGSEAAEGHQGEVNDCAFSFDDRLIVSASSDGAVKVWEVESGKCLATFYDKGEMFCCRMVGDMIYAGGTQGLYFLKLVRP